MTEKKRHEWSISTWDGQFSPMAEFGNDLGWLEWQDGDVVVTCRPEKREGNEYVHVPASVMEEFIAAGRAYDERRPPHCLKCGFVMCEEFDERTVNPHCTALVPNGKFVCRSRKCREIEG